MKCPICVTADLMMSDRSGVEIDYCPQCRGVWLDRGELDKIIERAANYEQSTLRIPPSGAATGAPSGTASNLPPRKSKADYDDYYDDDYRYDDDRSQDRRYPPQKKRKSFLGDMFDIFD